MGVCQCTLTELAERVGARALSSPPAAADGPAGAGRGALRSLVQGRRAAGADSGPPQAMRTLSWKHTLGLVTMDVELADRTLSVAVTPVQAVVLLYFQDQGEPTDPLPAGPSHAPPVPAPRSC